MKSNTTTEKLLKKTMQQLAANLEVARTANGLTQDELAKRAKLSRPTISQLEGSGDTTPNPSISTLLSLSEALKIPLSLLLLSIDEMKVLSASSKLSDSSGSGDSDELQGLNQETTHMIQWLRSANVEETDTRIKQLGQRLKLEEATGMSSINRSAITAAAIGAALVPGIGLPIVGAMSALAMATLGRNIYKKNESTTDIAKARDVDGSAQRFPTSSRGLSGDESSAPVNTDQSTREKVPETKVESTLESVLAAMETLQAQVKELQNAQGSHKTHEP